MPLKNIIFCVPGNCDRGDWSGVGTRNGSMLPSNFCSPLAPRQAGMAMGEGSHILRQFFSLEVERQSGIGRFSPSVMRGPLGYRTMPQHLAHAFSQLRPCNPWSPLVLRVYIAWGHFRPRLYGGCCFQNAMTAPLQIAPGNSLALALKRSQESIKGRGVLL